MVDEDRFEEVALGHLKAIQRLDVDDEADKEMNDKIAAHFHDLLLEPPEDGMN